LDRRTYEVIAEVERSHWWYQGRRRILNAVVDQQLRERPVRGRTLDLGCGTGANLPVVERCGPPVGCDLSELALHFARTRGGYAQLLLADGTGLPFPDSTFEWAFAADILEHMDDVRASSELYRVLRPGGRAVITVPAFPSLWGPQDDASHHLRRYTRRTLLATLRGAGLRVRYDGFINTALWLPIFAVRRVVRLLGLRIESENTLHPGWSNTILERVFGAEARLVPRFRLPFGVSLLCVAERPAAGAGAGAGAGAD
jgi:SAM-dependent methyltransferase